MKNIIAIILGILFISIVVLLCFCSCIVASRSDDYWEDKKKELEKHNARR